MPPKQKKSKSSSGTNGGHLVEEQPLPATSSTSNHEIPMSTDPAPCEDGAPTVCSIVDEIEPRERALINHVVQQCAHREDVVDVDVAISSLYEVFPDSESIIGSDQFRRRVFEKLIAVDSLQRYAYRDVIVKPIYGEEHIAGDSTMVANAMASLGDELFVSPLQVPPRPHDPNSTVLRVYDGRTLQWKRIIPLPPMRSASKVVRLLACPVGVCIYVIVLPYGDDANYRGRTGRSDIYRQCDFYRLDPVTGTVTGSGSSGSIAYRTVTPARRSGHLLATTCDENGRGVRVIEIALEASGRVVRVIHLASIDLHRLLSNVQLAADNETLFVTSELIDHGPEKISMLRTTRVVDEKLRRLLKLPNDTQEVLEVSGDEIDSFIDTCVEGSMVLDVHPDGQLLVMEKTESMFRLQLYGTGPLKPRRVVGIIGNVSVNPGPYLPYYNRERGILYWQTRNKFEAFRLWRSDVD